MFIRNKKYFGVLALLFFSAIVVAIAAIPQERVGLWMGQLTGDNKVCGPGTYWPDYQIIEVNGRYACVHSNGRCCTTINGEKKCVSTTQQVNMGNGVTMYGFQACRIRVSGTIDILDYYHMDPADQCGTNQCLDVVDDVDSGGSGICPLPKNRGEIIATGFEEHGCYSTGDCQNALQVSRGGVCVFEGNNSVGTCRAGCTANNHCPGNAVCIIPITGNPTRGSCSSCTNNLHCGSGLCQNGLCVSTCNEQNCTAPSAFAVQKQTGGIECTGDNCGMSPHAPPITMYYPRSCGPANFPPTNPLQCSWWGIIQGPTISAPNDPIQHPPVLHQCSAKGYCCNKNLHQCYGPIYGIQGESAPPEGGGVWCDEAFDEPRMIGNPSDWSNPYETWLPWETMADCVGACGVPIYNPCGDGVINGNDSTPYNGVDNPGEECDDGNLTSGDGCSATCQREHCGDGYHDPDGWLPDVVSGDEEECDDGNSNNNDGCNNNCKIVTSSASRASSVSNVSCTGGKTCTSKIACVNAGGTFDSQAWCEGDSTLCCLLPSSQSSSSSRSSTNSTTFCPNPPDCMAPPPGCGYQNPEYSSQGCLMSCGTLVCSSSSFSFSAQVSNSFSASSVLSGVQSSTPTSSTSSQLVVIGQSSSTSTGCSSDAECDIGICLNGACIPCTDQTECRNGQSCNGGICQAVSSSSTSNTVPSAGSNPSSSIFGVQSSSRSSTSSFLIAGNSSVVSGQNGGNDGGDIGTFGDDDDGGDTGTLGNPFFSSSSRTIALESSPQCGNGLREAAEQCDDANTQNGDGCAANCRIEQNTSQGTLIPQGPGCFSDSDCQTGRCLNGNCLPCADNSECAIGQCSNNVCTVPTLVAAAPLCGNGVLDSTEECDDNNSRDGDGCTQTCFSEFGVCGDGKVQKLLGEQCEPSLHNPTLPYQCVQCRFNSSTCGDAKLDPGEECDLGSQNSNQPDAACRTSCSRSRCGDAIKDSTEICDDGNRIDTDGCNQLCQGSQPAQVASNVTQSPQQNFPFAFNPTNINWPTSPSTQGMPFQLPLAQLQPLIQSQGPAGDTGPAAIMVVAAGAASGLAWARRKKK